MQPTSPAVATDTTPWLPFALTLCAVHCLPSPAHTPGEDDQSKGTQLLEIYALEIQMYTETKNSKRLKSLYNKALQIKSAIPHPKVRVRVRVRVRVSYP